jgi:hypothetical protein
MAETIKINIEISKDREKLLKIPERIRVPLNSIVQWNIVGMDKFFDLPEFIRTGLIFTLYFSDKTPFGWKRQFIQLQDPYFFPFYPNRIIRLAEDVADEKGDFKYGVKVTEAEGDKPLYDEDPFLIVY